MKFNVRPLRLALWICVATVVAASGFLILHPDWIKIEAVQIDMMPGASEDLLFQRIRNSLAPQLQHYAGRFFWQVPLTQVFELAQSDRRVRKVAVYRDFPSRLRVEIEPHTPALVYLGSDNRLYPLATDATLLPALPLSDAPDLPILRGEELKDEPNLRELALALLQEVPATGSFQRKNVSEIVYSKKDGFKVYLSGVDAEIKMGDADFGPRVARVERVLAYLDSQNIKGRVIDARFEKKVVVRVRNNP